MGKIRGTHKPKKKLVFFFHFCEIKTANINGASTCNDGILSILIGGVYSIFLSMHLLITRGDRCAYTMENKKFISNSQGFPNISMLLMSCEK